MTLTIDQAWPHAVEAANSWGGSEQMRQRIWNGLDPELRDKVQVITSRVREMRDDDVPKVLWVHDLPGDPENDHLQHPFMRQRFAKFVFVSYWQFQWFHRHYGVRYDESVIIPNAIEPIESHEKPKDGPIRLIYHTTPHRGLGLLVPCVRILKEHYKLDVTLDVYSSFGVYGWDQADEQFQPLFDEIKECEYMTYHGAQPNAVVREALKNAHIFAYPSLHLETSCLAAIEAMAAGCSVVAPNYGALPETLAPFGSVYHWSEDPEKHAYVFTHRLKSEIERFWTSGTQQRLASQVGYTNANYHVFPALDRWSQLLKHVSFLHEKQKEDEKNAAETSDVGGQPAFAGQACRIVPG